MRSQMTPEIEPADDAAGRASATASARRARRRSRGRRSRRRCAPAASTSRRSRPRRRCTAAPARRSATGRTAAADGVPAFAGCARRGWPRPAGAGASPAPAAATTTHAEHAEPDVGRAPADGLDEVLHDRRPDRAGHVVAAGADRHRDAAPAHEPQRGVGHQRRERRRASRAGRCNTPCAIANNQMLLDRPAPMKPSAEARRRRSASAASRRSRSARRPIHDAAEAEADHQQRVRQRGVGARDAELGLHRRQHHRRPRTCRPSRWSSAPA